MPLQNNDDLQLWDASFERNKKVHSGSILLGEPFMQDDIFKKAVILVCECTPSEGVLGFVLNKPSQLVLSDLFDDIDIDSIPIYNGGPCEEDTLHFVHTYGDRIANSNEMISGLYWGGDFNQLKRIINSEGYDETKIRFFLGYSGWQYAQLQNEILENTWVINNNLQHTLFSYDIASIWNDILTEMGGAYKLLISYPPNPSYN